MFCSVFVPPFLILLFFYSYVLHVWHIIKTWRLLHYLRIWIYLYFCIVVFTGIYPSVFRGRACSCWLWMWKIWIVSRMCICQYVHNRIRCQTVLARRCVMIVWYVCDIWWSSQWLSSPDGLSHTRRSLLSGEHVFSVTIVTVSVFCLTRITCILSSVSICGYV